MKNFVISVLGLSLLSACGGGGGGGDDSSSGRVDYKVAAYADEAQRLLDKYETADLTPAANLPTGRVTYRGVGVVNSNPGNPNRQQHSALGSASVHADFDKNRVSAVIQDFVKTDTGQILNGRVVMQNGTLRDGVIAGDIIGRLNGGAVGGVGGGAIYGGRGEAVSMGMEGRIRGGVFHGDFEGAIVAEQ